MNEGSVGLAELASSVISSEMTQPKPTLSLFCRRGRCSGLILHIRIGSSVNVSSFLTHLFGLLTYLDEGKEPKTNHKNPKRRSLETGWAGKSSPAHFILNRTFAAAHQEE